MKIQTEKDMRQIQLNEKIELSRTGEAGKTVKPGKALALNQLNSAKNAEAALGNAAGGASGKENATALAEGMEKAERLKAGMALIDGNKKLEQIRAEEESQDKAKETDKNEEDGSGKTDKDSVLLSKLSKLLSTDAKDKAYLWTLEMEMQLWEALLRWGPFGKGEDVRQNIQELSRIYQLLLRAIMENTEGDNRALQLSRLNQGLAQALNRLKDSSLTELFNFVEQFEGGKASADLRASLYYHVTGRTLSAKEANTFWDSGRQNAGSSIGIRGSQTDEGNLSGRSQISGKTSASGGNQARAGSQAAQRESFGNQIHEEGFRGRPRQGGATSVHNSGVRSFGAVEKGGIPSNSRTSLGGGEIASTASETAGALQRGRSAYLSSMKSKEEAAFMPLVGEKTGVYAVGGARSKASYSMADLQKAEHFAKYLKQGGNLFKSKEITAENEEVLGCLCADLEMKGRMFSDSFHLGDRMKTTVRSAVGNMVDCYLKEAEHRIQAKQEVCPLNRRDVYRVYYYILKQYQQRRDPALVMEEGILYASNLFEEKKKEEGYQHARRYAREAGFFGAASAREEERTGKKKGRRLFSDSWGQFRQLAESYGISYQELMQTSPWGMNLSPEAAGGKNSPGKAVAVFVITAVAVGAFVWINYVLH